MKWLLHPLEFRCGWVILGWYLIFGGVVIYVGYCVLKSVWGCISEFFSREERNV